MGSWKESVNVSLEVSEGVGCWFEEWEGEGEEGRALVRKRSERAVKRPVHSRGWRGVWIWEVLLLGSCLMGLGLGWKKR